jgi:SseB protein N-terminal domain
METCARTAAIICVAAAISGCEKSSIQNSAGMTTEEIIRQNAHEPMGKSVPLVAASLAKQSVFLATDDATETGPKEVTLQRFSFKTGEDKQGRTWAYAYTNRAEFGRAFPQGGGYIETDFGGFFHVVEKDAKFAGILLNGGSDSACAIPRE